jgi:hypothetical protein
LQRSVNQLLFEKLLILFWSEKKTVDLLIFLCPCSFISQISAGGRVQLVVRLLSSIVEVLNTSDVSAKALEITKFQTGL